MTACCAISGSDDGEGGETLSVDIRAAGKDHRCGECSGTILKGDRHEAYVLLFDGCVTTHRTCLDCLEIRNHFSCDGSWIFGHVWDDLESNLFPTMTAGGPCFEGLSPRAREILFDACLTWQENQGEARTEKRIARPPGTGEAVSPRGCSHLAIEVGGPLIFRDDPWRGARRRINGHEVCADCGSWRPLDGFGESVGEWLAAAELAKAESLSQLDANVW